MGLRNLNLLSLVILLMGSCASVKSVDPADRAKGKKFYFDCCNPGLDEGTKWMCGRAANEPDATIKDTYGNLYIFVWSECEKGKEPWREWENYGTKNR